MAGVSMQRLRKAWWQVHKWIALVLMVVLMPLGWSGAILAWDDAIDHQVNPQRYAVNGAPNLPPSAYAAAASSAAGDGARVTMLRYPDDGDGPVIAMASRPPREGARKPGPPPRISVWLDPATARVLDVSRGDSGIVRVAHNFHGSLFIPGGRGRALVGLLGTAMFLLAATGIWLWWPPIGSFLSGLRWRRGDRRLDTNLHHMIGFWIALPLGLQAFTGVWIAWPQMMQAVGAASARQADGPGRGGMMPAAHVLLTPDAALLAAKSQQPGQPSSIAWPTGKEARWRVSLATPRGNADVTIDDATSEAKPAKARGNGLAMLVRHIHDGSAIGWGWRLLMLLWAFAPTALSITGIIMWLRGRKWRAEVRRRGKDRHSEAVSEIVAAE